MWKAAAVLAWVPGLGFGLPCVYGIWYFAAHGTVWTFLGFPTYGAGPFESIGLDTTVPLLVAFLSVCLSELILGYLLWTRRGKVLAFALLPLELIFWTGFALPIGPLAGLIRTALLIRRAP